MKSVIEVSQLTKNYDKLRALDDLSFEVGEGEVFGLLGPNGAGKTTTIRVLNGILPRTSGTVKLFGLDPSTDGETIRSRTGVLTETPAMYERLTARQNLEFSGHMWNLDGARLKGRVDEILNLFDLSDRANDLVGGYSKGMKQRMALARAILHDPPLLFLDEPTSGLDPEASLQVNQFIAQTSRESGKTVFLCTHLLYEAQRLCDRVAVLNHGRLLAVGSPAELARDLFPGVKVDIEFEASLSDTLAGQVAGLDIVKGVEINSDAIRVQLSRASSVPDLVSALVAWGCRINSVHHVEVTLEEVYFALQNHENGVSHE